MMSASSQLLLLRRLAPPAPPNGHHPFLSNAHVERGANLLLAATRHAAANPAVPVHLTRRVMSSRPMYYYDTRVFRGGGGAALHLEEGRRRQSANVARLYARRVIELMAASAASARSVAEMEAATVSKPSEWGNGDRDANEELARGAVLGKTKVARVWAAGRRIANLTLLASPLFVLAPLARLAGPDSRLDDLAWRYALWSVEHAGPTFTKLAQWATTRSDLFPAEFVSRFAKLQDSTRGHPWRATDAALRETLGDDYGDVVRVDPHAEPIGSGCIAQVYRGTLGRATALLPAGTDVAIKVQHPNIRHKVLADFYIMNKVAGFVERIPGLNLDYLSIQDSVEQFRQIMLPQLDLRCEARNLDRFRKDFADDDEVTFPQPIRELSSRDVLVESFMYGEPILNYLRPVHTTKDRQTLATLGLSMSMKMIFLYDFVHGDLHPGNILVDRCKNGDLRLNVIDCGLVVEMGEQEHKNLVSILGAFVKKDGLLAGQLMVDTSKRCQASPLDVQMFCDGIERICTDDEENNFLEKVGDYLADICYLACRHKVKLEACFINAALAVEIMEGIATSLYPDMKVQTIALPMVLKAEVMHGMRHMKRPKFF